MRKILISGRLAANAEKKMMKGGREYLEFRIGNNEYSDEKDSEGKYTKTYWLRVTSFNPTHLGLASYLTKGKPVQIIGNYSDNMYQGKTGNCEIGRNVIADSIEFTETSNSNQYNSNNTSVPTTATPTKAMPTVTAAPTPAPMATPTVAPINADAGGDDVDDLPF